jgi:hypothetical protein
MSTNTVLYNQYGQPMELSRNELLESDLGNWNGYLATSMRLPQFHPDIFVATKGWKTLDEMLNMSPVRTALGIIRDAVLYKGWKVVPAVTDQLHSDYESASEIANALNYALDNIVDEAENSTDFRQVLFEMLYAIHAGFHVTDIDWRILEDGPAKGDLGFNGFWAKPCKQIGWDVNPNTLSVYNITSWTPVSGQQIMPVSKVLRYTFAPSNNMPYGNGLGRVAYKHSWTIDFLYRFWNIALELFGSPFILAKAPYGSLGFAAKVISRMRQGAPAVLPDNVEAELMEMTGKGLEGFKQSAEYHGGMIGYTYLSNTLTTNEGQRSGSMSLGKVHQDTQEYGLGGRRKDLEQILRYQLIRRWVRNNYGPQAMHLAPTISLGDWDTEDTERLANSYEKLIRSTIAHPAEPQFREQLGLGPLEPKLRAQMEEIWSKLGTSPPPPDPTPPPT